MAPTSGGEQPAAARGGEHAATKRKDGAGRRGGGRGRGQGGDRRAGAGAGAGGLLGPIWQKLEALEFPHEYPQMRPAMLREEEHFRALVLWLENRKIRALPEDDRVGLRVELGPEWYNALRSYVCTSLGASERRFHAGPGNVAEEGRLRCAPALWSVLPGAGSGTTVRGR